MTDTWQYKNQLFFGLQKVYARDNGIQHLRTKRFKTQSYNKKNSYILRANKKSITYEESGIFLCNTRELSYSSQLFAFL